MLAVGGVEWDALVEWKAEGRGRDAGLYICPVTLAMHSPMSGLLEPLAYTGRVGWAGLDLDNSFEASKPSNALGTYRDAVKFHGVICIRLCRKGYLLHNGSNRSAISRTASHRNMRCSGLQVFLVDHTMLHPS